MAHIQALSHVSDENSGVTDLKSKKRSARKALGNLTNRAALQNTSQKSKLDVSLQKTVTRVRETPILTPRPQPSYLDSVEHASNYVVPPFKVVDDGVEVAIIAQSLRPGWLSRTRSPIPLEFDEPDREPETKSWKLTESDWQFDLLSEDDL